MFDTLTSLFAPHCCLVCDAEGALLCEACSAQLLPAAGKCYRCRRLTEAGRTCSACRTHTKLHSVRAVTTYDQTAKELIGRLKFSGARAAADVVARCMVPLVAYDTVLIVHTPTANSRLRLRGYDQAALIAKALAHKTSLEYAPALLRLGEHRQVGASRTERLRQMQHSFSIQRPSMVAGRHVLLVDDVMTTGATLENAAQTLKTAGAKRVEAVVFARA